MKDNSALVYRDVAKKIVSKLKQSITDTIESGKSPDLYWKLEQAIVDAMKYADTVGCTRTREQLMEAMSKFEEDNGTSQN